MTNEEQTLANIRQTLADLDNDGFDARLYEGYSGRGMFGKECYGISSKEASDTDIIEYAAKNGLRGARADSLGRGVIVYWPHITAAKEQERQDFRERHAEGDPTAIAEGEQ